MMKKLFGLFNAISLLNQSELFDKDYYSKKYHIPKFLCVLYDILIGKKYANDPSEEFSAKRYYEQYPDVRACRMPALYHYLKHGAKEGRVYESADSEITRCPLIGLFDKKWYSNSYMSAGERKTMTAITHYYSFGWKQGYKPYELFDLERFRLENPECKEEPLYYWYRNRLSSLYFTDIPKAMFCQENRFLRALQIAFHYSQDAFERVLIPSETYNSELIVIMFPSYRNVRYGELLEYSKIYYKRMEIKSENQTVIAVTPPGSITFPSDTILPEGYYVFRYSQIIYHLLEWEKINLIIPDVLVEQYSQYLSYNTDDPLLHHQCKSILILDYAQAGDLRQTILDLSFLVPDVTKKYVLQERPEDCSYYGFFDKDWYSLTYEIEMQVDPLWHYLSIGWRNRFKPFVYFDLDRFYKRFPDCDVEPLYYLYTNRIPEYFFTEKAIPQMHFEGNAGLALQAMYRIRQDWMINEILPYDNKVERLMMILVSPEDAISGGIMSFYGIYHYSQELECIHGRKIVATTIPGNTTHAGFTMFSNDMPVLRYGQVIKRLRHVKDILIMIPETYVLGYLQYLIANTEDPVLHVEKRMINIMNQKIEIMPEPEILSELRIFFPTITQTVAHYKYCTQKERDYYGIPMHLLLPPIIKSFYNVPYEEKEDIFAYSYDTQPWKERLLGILRREFPNLMFIEIKNMTFQEYIELIEKAKWCMTFGEGLDGYFSEPYETGGISFAIWNDEYFTERYRHLPTVLPSVEEAMDRLPSLMNFLDSKEQYERTSKEVRLVHDEEYATERTSKDQLIDFFCNRFDYP